MTTSPTSPPGPPQPASAWPADPSTAQAIVLPVVLITGVMAGVAAAIAGPKGLAGAALGGLLVILFFGADHWLNRRTGRARPSSVMALALGGYAVKIGLLAGLLVVLGDTTLFSTAAFGAAILVATISWLALDVRAFLRRRILYVEPAPESAVITSHGSSAESVAPHAAARIEPTHDADRRGEDAV